MGWKQGSSSNTEVRTCMSVVMICLWNEDWEISVANGMEIDNQNVVKKLFPTFSLLSSSELTVEGQAKNLTFLPL